MLGRTHASLRRNRQDALASGKGEWGAFGVVSDGCGSAPHSEVGATLTASVAGNRLRASLRRGVAPLAALRDAHAAVLRCLRGVALLCATSSDEAETVDHDHLLATLVAFAMNREQAAILVVGDGMVRVDDTIVAHAHDDAPAYVSRAARADLERAFPAARAVAIATDGFDPESFDAISRVSSTDLTRHMTIRQRAGAFTDDAAIVVARREVES
ncbi:MAG: protein phosphatase 2C domain-containing protein [Polyangiaceae bacterium]